MNIDWDKPLQLVNSSVWHVLAVEKLDNRAGMHVVIIIHDSGDIKKIGVNSTTGDPPGWNKPKHFLKNAPEEEWVITAKYKTTFKSREEAEESVSSFLAKDNWVIECVKKQTV
jgi:hypothetical protein